MKKLIIIFVFLVISKSNFAQLDSVIKSYKHVYTSFKETKSTNPDSVFIIDLRSSGLRKLPKELLKYKNLEVILFGACNKKKCADRLNYFEKRSEKRRKKKLKASYLPSSFRPNNFNKCPPWIVNLKKLRFFDINGSSYRIKAIVELRNIQPTILFNPPWSDIEAEIIFSNNANLLGK